MPAGILCWGAYVLFPSCWLYLYLSSSPPASSAYVLTIVIGRPGCRHGLRAFRVPLRPREDASSGATTVPHRRIDAIHGSYGLSEADICRRGCKGIVPGTSCLTLQYLLALRLLAGLDSAISRRHGGDVRPLPVVYLYPTHHAANVVELQLATQHSRAFCCSRRFRICCKLHHVRSTLDHLFRRLTCSS